MKNEGVPVFAAKSIITFDYTKMGVEIKPVQKMYARKTANENSVIHRHNYIEFFYVTDGEGTHVINGENVTVKSGDAWLLVMNDSHGFTIKPDIPFRHTDIMINSDYFKDVCDFFMAGLYDDVITGKLNPRFTVSAEVRTRLEQFIPYLFLPPENPNYGLACKFISTQIVGFLTETSVRATAQTPPPPTWLSDLLTRLSSPENFTKTIAEITTEFSYNADYIRRVFKSHIGMNMTDYFNQCRMNHAYYLIKCTDSSICEICYTVGIDNVSYFYRLFRNAFNIAPGELRKHAF